jgi:hypothetical protein
MVIDLLGGVQGSLDVPALLQGHAGHVPHRA